jgi:alkylation response protein AidB-like acyl-CoA dehydrogenase
MRHFVDTEIIPFCHEWDESGEYVPRSMFERCGQVGILAAVCGAPWPKAFIPENLLPPGGIPAHEFDSFHEFIVKDEISRAASGGVLWGLMGGHTIALPPIAHFASDYIKSKVLPDCYSGKKVICLAVTEPYAGSDVANIRTEARKTQDGKHYIVSFFLYATVRR